MVFTSRDGQDPHLKNKETGSHFTRQTSQADVKTCSWRESLTQMPGAMEARSWGLSPVDVR